MLRTKFKDREAMPFKNQMTQSLIKFKNYQKEKHQKSSHF